jgi:hypothetical protein
MTQNFEKVKNYLFELGYKIQHEDEKEELVVISKESKGINNLIIDCEEPVIIFEQLIFELKNNNEASILLRLLQMNRELVHGAFVIDETGKKVLFRDTLQLENLDLNELKASIDSLSLAMAEYSNELINFSK